MSLCSVLPLFISTPPTTATSKSIQRGNRNWALQRLRIVAKSKSDASPSSSTPTSLLSFLCPLLTLLSNARIVREALCELELPYILQNVGEGSDRMKLLLNASGSKEVRILWYIQSYGKSATEVLIIKYLNMYNNL
ncbi:hypothetical protein V8G54_027252 [Vigna mungo]|uniref:Uncharacterized protein n=1 Tax=Vigna mungo TaxID=3915 RepID=A0AAQ3N235_VIGMU